MASEQTMFGVCVFQGFGSLWSNLMLDLLLSASCSQGVSQLCVPCAEQWGDQVHASEPTCQPEVRLQLHCFSSSGDLCMLISICICKSSWSYWRQPVTLWWKVLKAQLIWHCQHLQCQHTSAHLCPSFLPIAWGKHQNMYQEPVPLIPMWESRNKLLAQPDRVAIWGWTSGWKISLLLPVSVLTLPLK